MHTFGIFTKSQKGVVFSQMNASFVEGVSHPNHPDNPESPNRPRVDRSIGYINPMLGDPGRGGIGRWQQMTLGSLEVVIQQIIEQYLKDRSWYSSVRCREALWNMYRRIEWWVRNGVDPSKNDYQRSLILIKDCINGILEEAQDPELAHNPDIPLCPAPYNVPYGAYFYNHFNGVPIEQEVFDLKDFPTMSTFPGMLRYVSATEDQEWKLVHSVGGDESTGTENIIKLQIDNLLISNSSKVTFNFRFKRKGTIKFKYWASVAQGNGLTFFINGNQVGGEWHSNSGWQTVQYNVSPGQTYKFDWFIRRQNIGSFGYNGVYIKDIECVEITNTVEAPTPLDTDTVGEFAKDNEWVVYSTKSVARAEFKGYVTQPKDLVYDLTSDCDGDLSFSYKLGVADDEVNPKFDHILMYDEGFDLLTVTSQGKHGSSVVSNVGWNQLGNIAETKGNNAVITYNIVVGDACEIDVAGTVKVICPKQEIDHYEPYSIGNMNTVAWNYDGVRPWVFYNDGVKNLIKLEEPVAGNSRAFINVNMPDDGWFVFSYQHDLRPSEHFEVIVDSHSFHYSGAESAGNNLTIPLTAGAHTISFYVMDTLTEQPVSFKFGKSFSYESTGGTINAPFGSSLVVNRGWENITKSGATTTVDNSTIQYSISLEPGSSFHLEEWLRVYPKIVPPDAFTGMNGVDVKIFEEGFNNEDDIDPAIVFSANWEWEDIITRINGGSGDGVMKVEGHDNSVNTATLTKTLSTSGFIFFQYGGMFAAKEYLEFHVDDAIVWAGNDNNDTVGTNIIIPLPQGTHTFKWVYKDLGGTFVPDGGNESEDAGTDPWDEECFPSGNANHPIGYGSVANTNSTPRQSLMQTNGLGGAQTFNDGGGNPVAHGSTTDGAVVSRDLKIPLYGSIGYSEVLKVYAAVEQNTSGLRQLKSNINIYPGRNSFHTLPDGSKYYSLLTKNVSPVPKTGAIDAFNHADVIWQRVYTDRMIQFSYDILAYVQDNRSRGRVEVKYCKEGEESFLDGHILFESLQNVGTNYKQSFASVTNWSGAVHKQHTIKVPTPGWYLVAFALVDVYSDSDTDSQGYAYHASLKNISIQTEDITSQNGGQLTQPAAVNDGSYVQARLIDKSTGAVVSNQNYTAPGGLGQYNIQFNNLIPGNSYKLEYTLHKGDGTTGGLGNGGAFSVSQGQFSEQWGAYCKDNQGNYYAQGNSPHPGEGGGGGTTVPPDSSWCWIDVIRIYENANPPCTGTQIDIVAKEGATTIYSTSVTSRVGVLVPVDISNSSNIVKNYTITYTFQQVCSGDGGQIWGGSFEFDETKAPEPSIAKVWGLDITGNLPVVMGGCDGSKVTVTLYDQANVVISQSNHVGDGFSTFSVVDLPDSTYSSIRVEIKTTQNGSISSVTGKDYRTIFQLNDFKVYEEWEYVPSPINSQLELYIDDVLIDTYSGLGGFFTESYPVLKGSHEYRWTFKTNHAPGAVNYDFAELDWVKLTGWLCDNIKVIPYCDPGGGNICIEELIKCLFKIWNDRPKVCVVGKRVWLFT